MNRFHVAYSHQRKSWCIYKRYGPGMYKVVEEGLDNKEDAEFYLEILIGMNEP